tara:strand:- start:10 stop:441 length:432 start_codon:yes stop_codon:yes gene_type:complete
MEKLKSVDYSTKFGMETIIDISLKRRSICPKDKIIRDIDRQIGLCSGDFKIDLFYVKKPNLFWKKHPTDENKLLWSLKHRGKKLDCIGSMKCWECENDSNKLIQQMTNVKNVIEGFSIDDEFFNLIKNQTSLKKKEVMKADNN